jgi:hypothetical protein
LCPGKQGEQKEKDQNKLSSTFLSFPLFRENSKKIEILSSFVFIEKYNKNVTRKHYEFL